MRVDRAEGELINNPSISVTSSLGRPPLFGIRTTAGGGNWLTGFSDIRDHSGDPSGGSDPRIFEPLGK